MKTTLISNYKAALRALELERTKLTARLSKINETLNSTSTNNGHIRSADRRPGVRNKQSLEAAVSEALRNGPLTKQQILEAITSSGYKFSTDKPMASLNALLYRAQGGFSHRHGKFRVKVGR